MSVVVGIGNIVASTGDDGVVIEFEDSVEVLVAGDAGPVVGKIVVDSIIVSPAVESLVTSNSTEGVGIITVLTIAIGLEAVGIGGSVIGGRTGPSVGAPGGNGVVGEGSVVGSSDVVSGLG